MRKILTGLCASALALSMGVTGLLPAEAAPVYVQTIAPEASSNVINVQSRDDYRWRRHMRHDRREARRWDNDRPGYYRGYHGSRYYRHGWRRHGDYWFPAAAFVAGALVTGAIANSQPRVVYRSGNAHTQWCYNRYRSYRAYDNTFQPYNGPRQQCLSPYN